MKKIIVILMSLGLLFTASACTKKTDIQKNEKKKEEQTSNVYIENQTVDNISFENFAITKDTVSNNYILYFNVKNKTTNPINVGKVTVTLYSEETALFSLDVDVDKTLVKDESADVIEYLDTIPSGIDKVEYKLG